MKWTDQVFAYCERGGDPGFWAEPLNAMSNAAFIAAALLALRHWRRDHHGRPEALLIGMIFVIGIGSFLFHTFATRWARLADTVPIGIFMVAYLAFAARRFLALGWIVTLVCVLAFLAVSAVAGVATCSGGACLNGSAGYLPALAALTGVTAIAFGRGHRAAPGLALATGIFLLALVLRSVDMAVCPATLIQPGWRTGTHMLWHLANSVVLYVLARTALRHGKAIRQR